MKSIVLLTTITFLFSGLSFAQDQPVAEKKCTKECCKQKDARKKDKCCDKKTTVAAKPAAARKA